MAFCGFFRVIARSDFGDRRVPILVIAMLRNPHRSLVPTFFKAFFGGTQVALSFRMRTILIGICLFTLAFSSSARADAIDCFGGHGMVAGTPIIASASLTIPTKDGTEWTVSPPAINDVFGAAECKCPSTTSPVELMIQVIESGIPLGATGAAQVWVGAGCDSAAVRNSTTQTSCQQLATNLTFDDFTAAGGGKIVIPINGQSLTSPNSPASAACTDNFSHANGIYVLVGDLSNPAICSIPLIEDLASPAQVGSPAITSDHDSATITWQPASLSSSSPFPFPFGFQILCADSCGRPLSPGAHQSAYSTCVGGTIARRESIPTGTATIATSDGGTANEIVDAGVPDLATIGESTNDCGSDAIANPFAELDPHYICSDEIIWAGGSAMSAHILGLKSGETYQFQILSVSASGNATPLSAALATTTLPTAAGCSFAPRHDATTSLPTAMLILCLIGFHFRKRDAT